MCRICSGSSGIAGAWSFTLSPFTPEAWFLLGSYASAAGAAIWYARRRRSREATALLCLLVGLLAIEAVRTYLAPLDNRLAAVCDNMLFIAQALAPAMAAETVLLRRSGKHTAVALGLLWVALGLASGFVYRQQPRVELVAVCASLWLTWRWYRRRPAVKPHHVAALAIIAVSAGGLLFLRGDITSRQLWAENGKVWAWMMLLVAFKLIQGSWGSSKEP